MALTENNDDKGSEKVTKKNKYASLQIFPRQFGRI